MRIVREGLFRVYRVREAELVRCWFFAIDPKITRTSGHTDHFKFDSHSRSHMLILMLKSLWRYNFNDRWQMENSNSRLWTDPKFSKSRLRIIWQHNLEFSWRKGAISNISSSSSVGSGMISQWSSSDSTYTWHVQHAWIDYCTFTDINPDMTYQCGLARALNVNIVTMCQE